MNRLLLKRRAESGLRRLLALPLGFSRGYARALDKIRPGYGTSLAESQSQRSLSHQRIDTANTAVTRPGDKALTDGVEMKVLFAGREAIYGILRACFKTLGVESRVAELGVLDGTNAARIRDVLEPAQLYLVDAWSKDAFLDYRQANAHRAWVDDLDRYAEYFGGSLNEQATFDRLYDAVATRFAGQPNVEIIRASTAIARDRLRHSLRGALLDLVYVDASHQ